MTLDQLTEKIQRKANAEMQVAIKKLRADIAAALKEFGIGFPLNEPYFLDEAKVILALLISPEPKKGWPAIYWRRREARLMDEVLATMDTLQKVLLVKPSIEPGDEPAPEVAS